MKQRIFGTLATAILATLALCHVGSAQNYPTGPVRIIVPYGAGAPDTTARILAEPLSTQTGQSFYVDNRPGASGVVGTAIVTQAPPDGYTLLLHSDTLSILPSIMKSLPFDVQKDLAPVSMIGSLAGSYVVVNNDVPVHNLQELIAYIRASKTPLKYGSAGVGSGAHLRMAVLAKAENISLVHVPFKGLGDAATALLGGEVQVEYLIAPTALPLITSGKVRAIAYENPTRDPALPDVPTMLEAGAPPGGIGNSWLAVFAPANTPEPIVTRLAMQIKNAIAVPTTAERLKNVGINPVGSTPDQLKQTLASYIVEMHDALEAAGVQPQ